MTINCEACGKEMQDGWKACPFCGGVLQLARPCDCGSGQNYTERFGGLELEMVWIPAGRFNMGSPEDDEHAFDREHPLHSVTLDGYWMGKFAVTNAQFRRFRPDHYSGEWVGNDLNGDGQPVVMVSWDDTAAFCEWLTRGSSHDYRLPSEAQWEYACRAGTTTPWHWGDEEETHCYANIADQALKSATQGNKDFDAWIFSNGNDGFVVTSPVGRFCPNAFGLYDMSGNVLEWCRDWHHDSYGGAPTDGSAWLSPKTENRMLRGGNWHFGPRYCRSAYRTDRDTGTRLTYGGFRVVR
ncbi:MAG: SUMF1/EgtB/PvdO family nonheme iron enzyme [Candidatus Sumerlaeota bacterium]|nr:SUMF1/EgtB/PvdO family nonheme iron enzyme [Candidatus Sumerlaeota bacterium]